MKSAFFRFCLLACIPLFCIACSHSKKTSISGNEFLIEGEISDVKNGAVVELYRRDESALTRIASDKIKKGRFILKAEATSETEQMSIGVTADDFPSTLISIWVTQGVKIKIKGNGKLHPLWEVESSVPYQQEENLYANNNRDITAEFSRLNVERNILRKKRNASSGDKALAYRAAADSVEAISDALRDKQYFAYMDIMEKTDISPVWLDKMEGISGILRYSDDGNEFYGEHRKKAEALYDRMSEEDKTTLIGSKITAFLFPPSVVEVGDDFADAEFFDINGNTKHISDYLGKYLLLDFWFSNCGPCIAAIPEMKEIAKTYSEKLTIISISIDSDAIWKKAMNEHNMPWVNIRDPKAISGVAANYGVYGMPNYIMISPEGEIVDKWDGYSKGSLKRKVSENVK